MTLAERVKKRRLELGLSQEKVARKADLSWAAIQRMEAGRITDPHYSTLSAVAQALGVSVAELAGEEPAVPLDDAPSSEDSEEPGLLMEAPYATPAEFDEVWADATEFTRAARAHYLERGMLLSLSDVQDSRGNRVEVRAVPLSQESSSARRRKKVGG